MNDNQTLLKLEVGTFATSFKTVFKHSSTARSTTENIIVRVSDQTGCLGYGEGCPRDYVTGETTDSAKQFINKYGPDLIKNIKNVKELGLWINENETHIDSNPAAFCALELACLDYFGRKSSKSIEEVLGLQNSQSSFQYSAVLGDSRPIIFFLQLARYRIVGFKHYKFKLSGDLKRDLSKSWWFKNRIGNIVAESVRVDANNHWADTQEAAQHIEALDLDLLGVEEPLEANNLEGFLQVAALSNSKIILDESLLRNNQISNLPGDQSNWIFNCRISKSGGLIRSLKMINAAKAKGIGIIVGAHVGETSILTRAALAAVIASEDNLIAQEGAFGTKLLENDICSESIMFSKAGILKIDLSKGEGLGIDINQDLISFYKD